MTRWSVVEKLESNSPLPKTKLLLTDSVIFGIIDSQKALEMKKIDILNYITDFRKAPNDIKTYKEILSHLGAADEAQLNMLLNEMQQMRAVKQVEKNGERAYQVAAK
jgi:hypothetical protein